MPRLDLDAARYVGRVVEALAAGRVLAVIRQSCPACGDDHPDPATHVIVDTDQDGPIVLIACDSYRVIDPNTVGLVEPYWQPS